MPAGAKGSDAPTAENTFYNFQRNERKGRGSKMDMEDTSKLKIFTGNSHPALAKEISDYIGVPLGKAICGKFNNAVRDDIVSQINGKGLHINIAL